ncbi:MAG: Fe-S protein assembly co-chaperone HscB [Gammaproteobacteria bacterium]
MSPEQAKTHFELFALPVAYQVDGEALNARYRELQRTMHPDRFANAPDRERRLAMEQAAQLNEAFRVLRDPLARARYLLELRGHRFDDEHSTTRDPQFLMEQMELREALAEVRDSADPLGRVGELTDQIAARLNAMSARLGELFEQTAAEAQQDAVQTVLRMQFFRRLEDEARNLEADLEDELDAP